MDHIMKARLACVHSRPFLRWLLFSIHVSRDDNQNDSYNNEDDGGWRGSVKTDKKQQDSDYDERKSQSLNCILVRAMQALT
jgi:hypothetical protein